MNVKTCFRASYGEGESLCITVGRILFIQHVIQCGDFPIGVSNLRKVTWVKCRRLYQGGAYDRELNICRSYFRAVGVYVLDPFVVFLEAISGDANDLHVALLEIRSTTSDLSKFSGADRSKISGMREKDGL